MSQNRFQSHTFSTHDSSPLASFPLPSEAYAIPGRSNVDLGFAGESAISMTAEVWIDDATDAAAEAPPERNVPVKPDSAFRSPFSSNWSMSMSVASGPVSEILM